MCQGQLQQYVSRSFYFLSLMPAGPTCYMPPLARAPCSPFVRDPIIFYGHASGSNPPRHDVSRRRPHDRRARSGAMADDAPWHMTTPTRRRPWRRWRPQRAAVPAMATTTRRRRRWRLQRDSSGADDGGCTATAAAAAMAACDTAATATMAPAT